MKYEYTPRGVCSRKMILEVEDGVITDLKVEGGCSGNLQGISSLVKGMKIDEVIERLSGIRCGANPHPVLRSLRRRLNRSKPKIDRSIT